MTATTVTLELEDHLKKWFGYNTFRSYQKEIVEGILQKKDVLAILPTGAGKSLCYQLPAMLVEGTAVVVSPLISLMQDQVASLIKNGIPAAYINSSLPLYELNDVLHNMTDYKLLYVAPERFTDPNFLFRLKEMPISFFVIDEAHCISQWGHSFRPDYRQLSLIKKTFPDKPLMALTATATPEVEEDIASQLVMQSPLVAKGSFDRPNLMVRIQSKSEAYRQIRSFLQKHPGQSGIIYAATRKTVDTLYEQLKDEGFKLGKYHAGLGDRERTEALHDFIHDKTNLMIATVAFGMGINKPDIRFILHHDMPRNIEQYYQEMGRAGRDGLPAECLMLYSAQDLMIYKSFLKDVTDLELRKHTEFKTEAMFSLCRSLKCRRIGLLQYFGERYLTPNCNSCDNCVDDEEKIDGTVIAQKILSCVHRLNNGFGIKYVVDVLRGSKSSQVINRRHDQLSTYGIMSEYSEIEVRYYIDALLMLGLLQSSGGDYPVIQWTEKSREAIKGEQKIEFRKKIFKDKVKEITHLPYNVTLFNQLRQLRMEMARQEDIPPFAVFADRSLLEMATYFPHDDEAFLAINGVGRLKLEKYGKAFMQVIVTFCAEQGLTPKPRVVEPVYVRKEFASSPYVPKKNTVQETYELFALGKSLPDIAQIRSLTVSTIISHLCQWIASTAGQSVNIDTLVSKEKQELIIKIANEVGREKLTPIKEKLPEDISFEDIRFVLAKMSHRVS